MELVAQLFVNGAVIGSLFALIGLGFGLIYGVTRHFHFAHGVTFCIAGYVAWLAVRYFGWPLWLAAVPAVVAAVIFGALCELLMYRPMRRRNASPAGVVMASFGAFIVGTNLLQIAFGSEGLTYSNAMVQPLLLDPVVITTRDVITVGFAAVALVAVHLVLSLTSAGRALRAVVDSPAMSSVVGIDLPSVYLISFIVGSALTAPAAVLYVSYATATPGMGLNIVFPAVATVIIGGLGSLRGAAFAGLLLGLAQNLLVLALSPEWQSSITFAVMILFFLMRPQGLFGQPLRAKV